MTAPAMPAKIHQDIDAIPLDLFGPILQGQRTQTAPVVRSLTEPVCGCVLLPQGIAIQLIAIMVRIPEQRQKKIRRRMMTNPRAADICAMIEKLIDCGIDLHTQIVLCPGYNDGKVLEETLGKLYSYMPSILSVAVVPVGLSRYRDGLVNLTAFDEAGARRTIAIAEKWQKRARSEYGRSFVYLGDEFYFKARMPMPPAAWYDGFPELEDGIGMIRRFEEKWKNFEFPKPGGPKKETHIAVPCGQMVSSWMQKAADTLRIPNLYIHILPVVNQWFGSGINVTGLLTAGDILCAVQKMPFKADGMILPEVILRKGEKVFLDDVTFDDFADRIGYPVKICRFADDFLETLYLWE